ncbi:hypothetical protein M601_019655 [Cellulophaga baltica 4]|nr:hypothetical protein M601_019655 [Cellulophaga baltica 4]
MVPWYLRRKKVFFFLEEGGGVEKWNTSISKELQELNIYSSAQLKNGSFILGTISDGVYHVSKSGELLEKINQKKGLNDNTILSIFEDLDGNVWLGLNNGISVLNFSAPFKEYIDTVGKLGVVYTAAIYEDHLYLGTNQGLFYKQKSGNDDFKIVPNTNGQVWFLKEIDGILFCGHNAGTFTVAGNQATQIATFPGAWDIKKFQAMIHFCYRVITTDSVFLKRKVRNGYLEIKLKDLIFLVGFLNLPKVKIFLLIMSSKGSLG